MSCVLEILISAPSAPLVPSFAGSGGTTASILPSGSGIFNLAPGTSEENKGTSLETVDLSSLWPKSFFAPAAEGVSLPGTLIPASSVISPNVSVIGLVITCFAASPKGRTTLDTSGTNFFLIYG